MQQNDFFHGSDPNEFYQGPLSGGRRSPKLFKIQKWNWKTPKTPKNNQKCPNMPKYAQICHKTTSFMVLTQINFIRALFQGVWGVTNYLKSKNEIEKHKKHPKIKKNLKYAQICYKITFFIVLTLNEFFQSYLLGGLKNPILFYIQKWSEKRPKIPKNTQKF